MYCSDGRVGEHFDDFLFNGLSLPRYDRLALPGGPGCLAGHEKARLEHDSVLDELRFLVEAHELDRVVLIQHEGCAFYLQRLGIDPAGLKARQMMDLSAAAKTIRDELNIAQVEGYYARPDAGGLLIEAVDLELGRKKT